VSASTFLARSPGSYDNVCPGIKKEGGRKEHMSRREENEIKVGNGTRRAEGVRKVKRVAEKLEKCAKAKESLSLAGPTRYVPLLRF